MLKQGEGGMKKILQLADSPIMAYPDYTYALSIILNYEDGFIFSADYLSLYHITDIHFVS